MYYFGYLKGGHYLHNHYLEPVSEIPAEFGSHAAKLDGELCVKFPIQPEGVVTLTKVGRFTVIAFWDRSGDSRPNSNSAFAEEGDYSFEEMVEMSKERFPTVFSRFYFKLVPVRVLGAL